jgi:uncharacterized protein
MNTVIHFELPGDDVERMKTFYQEVFGWQIKRIPIPSADYYMAVTTESNEYGQPTKVGSINGGMRLRDEVAPNPVVVIEVDDINAHLEKAVAAGGTIVQPVSQVGAMGYYARIKDTENNVVGIWQNLTPTPIQ